MQDGRSTQEQIISLQLLKDEGRLVGEFKDIPNEVYHDPSCPALSRSAILMARKSLATYKAYKNGLRKEPTPALEFGSMFHEFILEPEVFNSKFIAPFSEPRPEGNATKLEKNGGCKEAYQAWKGRHADYILDNGGKSEVSEKEWKLLHGMKESLMQIEIVRVLLTDKDTQFENTYFFTHPKTGQLMKIRPDIINTRLRIMVDLKSCIDASENGFGKFMANTFADVQGAMYLDGAEALFGESWTFGFIAVEKAEPYLVGLHSLSESDREVGEKIFLEGANAIKGIKSLDEIKNCYSERFSDCSLPAWAYTTDYR